MIYEFALEPELVASWADRTAYRFFDGKFGIGGRRIASAFPAKDKWRAMVVHALDDAFRHDEPEQGPCLQCAKKQAALQRLETLLGHLRKDMVERTGTMPATWRDGAVREHGGRKFQGILAVSSPRPASPILCADDIDESTAVWNPPRPPTPRRVADVVRALEPLLRFASEVRFVDPYLDASASEFFDPLEALVKVAQSRTKHLEPAQAAGGARSCENRPTRASASVARRQAGHSLTELRDGVLSVKKHFPNGSPLIGELRWSKRATTSLWGFCRYSDKSITLNCVLNSPDVPLFVVEFLMFHEMLHADMPSAGHNRDFRQRERSYSPSVDALEDATKRGVKPGPNAGADFWRVRADMFFDTFERYYAHKKPGAGMDL